MTGTILVTGASGTVGSEVATALRAAGAAYVVGLRAPAAASHPAVAFDFSAPATFDAALRGVERVFLIAPGFHEHADALLAPFIAALKPAGVKHVVYSSVSGADQNPAGAHRKIELALEATGLALTILRPTFYMQNFLTYERDNLLLRGVIDLPTAEGKAAYVDVRDIAAVAAKVLVDGGHAGQAYDLTGDEALSHGKIAAVFSEALGFTVRFLDPSPEAYAQTLRGYGMEAWMVEASAELYGYVRQGYTAATSDNVSKLLGRPATRLEAFAADRGRAALRAIPGAVPTDAATLVSNTNALMTAWEEGDEALYRRLSAPHVRMTISNFKLDVSGFDAVWGVRASVKPLKDGPLHIHTVDTHVVEGHAVRAQSHVISRENGRFTQHARVRFSYDHAGRLAHYHQENIWSP